MIVTDKALAAAFTALAEKIGNNPNNNSNLVTLDTEQEITGRKTFSAGIDTKEISFPNGASVSNSANGVEIESRELNIDADVFIKNTGMLEVQGGSVGIIDGGIYLTTSKDNGANISINSNGITYRDETENTELFDEIISLRQTVSRLAEEIENLKAQIPDTSKFVTVDTDQTITGVKTLKTPHIVGLMSLESTNPQEKTITLGSSDNQLYISDEVFVAEGDVYVNNGYVFAEYDIEGRDVKARKEVYGYENVKAGNLFTMGKGDNSIYITNNEGNLAIDSGILTQGSIQTESNLIVATNATVGNNLTVAGTIYGTVFGNGGTTGGSVTPVGPGEIGGDDDGEDDGAE